jgi:hypothetical protein
MLNSQCDVSIMDQSQYERMLIAYSEAMDGWMDQVQRGKMTSKELTRLCREREDYIMSSHGRYVTKFREDEAPRAPVVPEPIKEWLDDFYPADVFATRPAVMNVPPSAEDILKHLESTVVSPVFGAMNAMNDQFDGRNLIGRFEPVTERE